MIAYTVPRIAAVLGIGVMIDRLDRRRILWVANVLRCLAFGGLAFGLARNVVSLPTLYTIYAVIGLVETTSDNAVFSVLPSLATGERLDRANAQIAGTQLVLDEFIGPPLGGFLFAVASAVPLGASSFSCGIAALAFFLMRGSFRGASSEGKHTSVLEDLRAGLTCLRQNRIVLGLMITSGLASLAYSLPFSYLVLFAQRALGLDSRGYGLLLSFSSLGGLLGSFIAPRLRKRVGYGTGVISALLVGAISIVVCGATSNPIIAAVALAAYICHAVVWNILAGTVRQKAVPAELLGRTGSIGRLLGYLGIAIGAAAGGWMANVAGIRIPFYVSGLCFLGCVAIVARLHQQIRAWEAGLNNSATSE